MSGESSQPSRNPVRIVYHAENRTFARLFNEYALDELKDVVRRKLSLGRDTDVSLKQMGLDGLLDLEDDDDFEAFRVLLLSRVSVDIQVVVGRSQGRPVRSRTSVHFEEPPRPPVASSPSRSKEVAGSSFETAASESTEATGAPRFTAEDTRELDQLIDDWIVASKPTDAVETTQESTATEETPATSTRKRKVSTSDTAAATTRAASKATATEEPVKKKLRKETVKAKDAEDSFTKASPAPKTRVRKSVAADKGKEAGTSAPKDAEASKSPAKTSGKQNKDDSIVSNEHVNPSGMDQPISQPGNLINDGSIQLEEAPVARSSVRSGVSKTRREPTIGVCAAVPRTSESATVQTEVAAAILSMASEIALSLPPPPPPRPKRKYVRKNPKILSATSAKSKTVSHAANQVPNVPAEQRLEPVIPTNASLPQARWLNGPSCPICEEEPFHIRYYCPIVSDGPDAIRERLEEVKRTNAGNQLSLIKELEALLRDPKVTSEASSNAARPREVSPPSISVSRVPTIPGNSNLSELTVEDRDEGSSSESSNDVLEEVIEQDEVSPAPGQEKMPDRELPPSNDDLDAVICGPALKRHSILNVLDRIVGDEGGEHSDSEVDQVQDELEDEDTDEEIDRPRRRLSKHVYSSDSESEDEEFRSPSPSHSDEDNLEPGVHGSNTNIPVQESTERQGNDVVMKNGAVPSVPAGQGDASSEETHVGSEDRMAVDDPIREKATVIVAEQLSSRATRTTPLQPSDVSSNEPQESVRTEVNHDVGASNEAAADPIEPADDLEPPTNSHSSNADPIELLSEDFSTGITQSTPNPGVTKRIKNRNGQTLDDEAEPPVLVEQLTSETTADVTPLSTKAKSRRKVTEKSSGQEPMSTRKSPRFSSLPPATTSTPAAVALLNHRAKVGVRSGKTPKTSAKLSDASQSSAKNDNACNGARIAATPSLVEWETLAAPSSSPSLQPDEPSVLIDELLSSSPQQDDRTIPGRSKVKPVKDKKTRRNVPNDAETPQEKQRLFDLTSSQIPFPYSQHKKNTATPTPVDGKVREERLDSDSEQEEPLMKTRAKPVQYRSLSELASQATLFSPSLPRPAIRSVTNAKTKKRVANEESSSSSSSEEEEEEEGNGSEHIPRGRRAGSVLETKKRKSVLSRLP